MTITAGYRPGSVVEFRSDPPPRGLQSDSGTWFVVGVAQKGPTAKAQLVRSLQEFVTFFGTRQSYSILYDAMETFFREGGQRAYIVRAAGASAVAATKTLLDGSAGNSLQVTAKNPGTWGNGLSVAVTQPVTNFFQINITQGGVLVDQSPLCASQADGINWSLKSDWVNVAFPSSPSALIPAVASASALTSGADDNAPTDNQRQAALAFFTADLGGGQVSMPGNTTSGNRIALNIHGGLYQRQAILDNTDTASRSAAVTEATALQAAGNEFSAMFGPWNIIPGLSSGLSNRVVPPCALVAALMARSDASNSVNVPALGDNGRARFVLDVTQPAWSDSDRDQLNTAGLNVIRTIAGQGVELYGYRTLANPLIDASWLGLGNQRLRERITIQALDLANTFVGEQLDGKGRTVARFGNALKDLLMQHYLDGALFGDTSDAAFMIDVDSVNTPTTLANNELHAVISLRMSPFAELVVISIIKVAVTQEI